LAERTGAPSNASFEMVTKQATDDTSQPGQEATYPGIYCADGNLNTSYTGFRLEAGPNPIFTVSFTETHQRGLYKFPYGRLHLLLYEALLACVGHLFVRPMCGFSAATRTPEAAFRQPRETS